MHDYSNMKSIQNLASSRSCVLALLSVAVSFACSSGGASSDETNETAGRGGEANGGNSGISIGDGGTSNNGGGSGEPTCGETAVVATERPVNVLILLDRSLSMTYPISTQEATTRWQALREGLVAATAPVASRVAFGLKLFPDGAQGNECSVLGTETEVDMDVGTGVVDAIDSALNEATPGGGTPITEALSWASRYFETGPGSQREGDRVILLATDGAPNCNSSNSCDEKTCITNIEHPEYTTNLCATDPTQCLDGARAKSQVEALAQMSKPVKTVVLGIPGTEYPAYSAILNELGQVGGLSNSDPKLDYYAVTAAEGVSGLSDTLRRITTELIVSCRLELESAPPDLNLLNVYVDGKVVVRDAADGWKLDSSTPRATIVLTGATCSKLETEGASSIAVRYGCPTVIIQ